MAAQQLTFHGINRAVSDYAASGSCEELINLRPTTEGLVPVRPFGDKFEGLNYDAFYEHKASNATNYIGVTLAFEDPGYLTLDFLDDAGDPIGETVEVVDIQNQSLMTIDDVHFAYAGNYVLISIAYKAEGEDDDDLYCNASFLWNGTEYVPQEANAPEIGVAVDYTLSTKTLSVDIDPDTQTDHSQLAERIDNALSQIIEEHKDVCFGPTIVALAYKTRDGETFWTNSWMVVDPIDTANANHASGSTARLGSDAIVTSPTRVEYEDVFTQFYAQHTYGYRTLIYDVNDSVHKVQLTGTKVKLTLSASSGFWNQGTSMIESVEVYASKPVKYIDPYVFVDGESGLSYGAYVKNVSVLGNHYLVMLPQKPYDEMELGDQLLYLQKSIPLTQFAESSYSIDVDLEFGGNLQVTNKTLNVDAGKVTRYGDMLSYNARFHFFDSFRNEDVSGGVTFDANLEYNFDDYDVLVAYDDGYKERVLYIANNVTLPTIADDIHCVVASSLNIKRVIFFRESSRLFKFHLYPSKRYNYAIGTSGLYEAFYGTEAEGDEETETALAAGIVTEVWVDEPSAINVTEQYNPFVFNVDNSYLAPGKVLNLQPQMMAVPDVSYGDYPLNIFTERGVYALLQGDGSVLYGAMRPISNLVAQSNGIPTENGTFFLAAGGMWVIAGSKAVLVSDALSLGPHKYIRNNDGYKYICGDSVVTSVGYDVHEYLSIVEFKDYIVNDPGAKLSYNRFRDEIYVSNFSYKYSYALSLKYRQWFKIDLKLAQDVPGASIALTPHTESDTGKPWDVLYFSYENKSADILVHLQSRPITLNGYQYAHIHRVIQMMRAELLNRFVLSVYGSDDLQNWTLVTYASRQGNTTETPIKRLKVSQIRTPSCARSWRYYTICFGGSVPATDTDFGPTLIDLEPVIRRIG